MPRVNAAYHFQSIKTEFFPGGKNKAVIISVDDGATQDKLLIELLNRYGLKGTFHLSSSRLDTQGHIKREDVNSVYEGHEVSLHTYAHKHMNQMVVEQVVNNIVLDRLCLEELVHYPIKGLAFPYGSYSRSTIETLKNMGIVYARTVKRAYNNFVPDDFFKWKANAFFLDNLIPLTEKFLKQDPHGKQNLFVAWGHSKEIEQNHQWDQMKTFCELLAGTQNDVWFTTLIGFWEYQNALKQLHSSLDGKVVKNLSATPIWLNIDGEVVKIDPNQIYKT